MSLMTLALLLLAAALVMFAATLLVQAHQRDRHVEMTDNAIHRIPAEMKVDHKNQAQPLAQRLQAWLARFGEQFQGGRIEQLLLAPEDRLLLDRCDRNTATGRTIYLALRLLLALILMAGIAIWQSDGRLGWFFGALAGLVTGLFLPKLFLDRWAKRMARRAGEELPLLVDLIRLLQGVGMSIDQSLHIVAEEFRDTVPVLGHELHLANVAYNRGRSREQSLQRVASVFNDDDLKALVGLIIQLSQHGGAAQEPLNQFSLRLRKRRQTRMKEASGKLSVKMTLVMMLTLLPALMMVLAGPAAIALTGSISRMGGG